MRFFKPNITKMLEQKDINGLVKALKDKDDRIAESAIKALSTRLS